MERSRIDSVTLIAAAIAAAVILWMSRGNFSYLTTIGSVVLLFVLFAYDQEGKRSIFQSLAFSAVCGLAVMVACAIIFQHSLGPDNGGLTGAALATYFQIRLGATWGLATTVIWIIDSARMSGRTAYEPQVPAVRATRRQTLIPEFTPSVPSASSPEPVQPAPSAVEPREVRPAPPVPVPEPPPQTATAAFAPPPESTPTPVQPRPVEPPPEPHVEAPPPVQPPPAPPLPAAVPVRPGKEVMVYVNLVGEGLNLLRSVRAEHLGRDFYKIIEDMPEGETWEYGPGQVVRCRKQKLSTGKALVAFEEAPRAQ